MNIVFWVLQVLLSLHTAIGAIWKFSHPAGETLLSLKVIPQGVWLGMSIVELMCSLALVLPLMYKPSSSAAPLAALVIAAEMLLFCGLHLFAGVENYGPMIYWLVVAVICALIAYGRMVLVPTSH